MFNHSAKFSKVEQAILSRVQDLLSPPARQLYSQQLALIDRVQRLVDDKEVDFYRKRGLLGIAPFPDHVKFACPADEFKMARIKLVNKDTNFKTKVDLYIVHGHIFSLEFAQAPKKLGSNFEITDAELLQDPMAPMTATETSIDASLPDDYLELLASAKNELNGWTIFPQSQIRTVVNEDANLLVLAEKRISDYCQSAAKIRRATYFFSTTTAAKQHWLEKAYEPVAKNFSLITLVHGSL